MLSEETAIGENPVESAETMGRILSFSENQGEINKIDNPIRNSSDSILEAAQKVAEQGESLVVFTKSGASAKRLSNYRLKQKIIAVTDEVKSYRDLNLYFGVRPYFKKFLSKSFDQEDKFFEELKGKGLIKNKEKVLVIHGNNWLESGTVSSLSLTTV